MIRLPSLIVVMLALCLVGCEMPRDPEGTYQRVEGGTLRVGVIESGAWARMQDGDAAGVEPTLVRRLAEELGAEVKWIQGSEHALLEALKRYELDLVVGGLTRESPWLRELAFTKPYVTVPIEVGVPPGSEAIGHIEGRTVAVREGTSVGAMVKEQGGTAVAMEAAQLAGHDGLVAAPRWQLEGWGHMPTEVILHRHQHAWHCHRARTAGLFMWSGSWNGSAARPRQCSSPRRRLSRFTLTEHGAGCLLRCSPR